jgi:hypothetical protein
MHARLHSPLSPYLSLSLSSLCSLRKSNENQKKEERSKFKLEALVHLISSHNQPDVLYPSARFICQQQKPGLHRPAVFPRSSLN